MDSDITRAARNQRNFTKAITSAANAGNVLVGTISTQECRIESIGLRAVSASQTNLTSAGVYGGVNIATHTVTFLSAIVAVKENLTNINDQICWKGIAILPPGSVISIELLGTGVTPVDLEIVIEYTTIVGGGVIS